LLKPDEESRTSVLIPIHTSKSLSSITLLFCIFGGSLQALEAYPNSRIFTKNLSLIIEAYKAAGQLSVPVSPREILIVSILKYIHPGETILNLRIGPVVSTTERIQAMPSG
jgi:hypothetical protein